NHRESHAKGLLFHNLTAFHWFLVLQGEERLICRVTGPRRFPPPNHATGFEIFFLGGSIGALKTRVGENDGGLPPVRGNSTEGGRSRTVDSQSARVSVPIRGHSRD